MNALTVKELYTLEETIAKDLLTKLTISVGSPSEYRFIYQRTREYVKQ